jgi:hypothetical protein
MTRSSDVVMRQKHNPPKAQNLIDNDIETPQYLESVMLLTENVGSHR